MPSGSNCLISWYQWTTTQCFKKRFSANSHVSYWVYYLLNLKSELDQCLLVSMERCHQNNLLFVSTKKQHLLFSVFSEWFFIYNLTYAVNQVKRSTILLLMKKRNSLISIQNWILKPKFMTSSRVRSIARRFFEHYNQLVNCAVNGPSQDENEICSQLQAAFNNNTIRPVFFNTLTWIRLLIVLKVDFYDSTPNPHQ